VAAAGLVVGAAAEQSEVEKSPARATMNGSRVERAGASAVSPMQLDLLSAGLAEVP